MLGCATNSDNGRAGAIALAVGAGGVFFGHFSLVYLFSFYLPLWEMARYGLNYCLKGPLNPKTINQPTTLILDSPFIILGVLCGTDYLGSRSAFSW